MAHVAFPISTFQNPDGSPVANGTLTVRLVSDGNANSSALQLQHNFTSILLDSSGTIIGSPLFWTNSSIAPSGTYYIYNVFSQQGQLVAGPNNITI